MKQTSFQSGVEGRGSDW